ncbi:MAG: sulfite exporter TauE/SafE family protein [Chitinophagaceae bacterium]|nr:sulfite exporter TauE/SafE family protein [Chitinophagaceae bacterium]
MTITSIAGIIVIGIVAGVLSSMVGIGGGIVIVPALVLFFGLSQHTAQGTTLAMLSVPVSLVAALTYYKKGMVDWRIALLLCIGFVVGGYFGSKVAVNIDGGIIKKVFAVVLILIALKFLFIDKQK